MLKDVLILTIKKINKLEAREEAIMKECIDMKLERSLKNYESHLEETCKYILSRNPISMIKALAADPQPKKKEEDE